MASISKNSFIKFLKRFSTDKFLTVFVHTQNQNLLFGMDPTSSLRPPSFPKASRNQTNTNRQRQLKDRLRVDWGNSKSSALSATNYATEEAVKGYGENQFNDSVFHDDMVDTASFLNNPSVYSQFQPADATFSGTKRSVTFAPQRSTGAPNTSMMMSLDSNALTHGTTSSTMYPPGKAKLAHLKKASKNLGASFYNSIPLESHLELTQSIHEEDGMKHITDSLIAGTAEFCYLDTNPNHHYRFEMKSNYPTDLSSGKSEYATISARGILRVNGDGSELTSFAEVTRENEIYCKLLHINLFKTFRVWKTFKCWKSFVKKKHFQERVSFSFLFSCVTSHFCFVIESRITKEYSPG